MRKGEICWCSIRAPKGSEPGYRRPIVVVQSNAFNRSRINTVIVAAITKNLFLAEAPGNFVISGRATGLTKKSVVNVSQLLTLDQRHLTEVVGRLNPPQLLQLNEGLKLVLSL